MRFAVVLFLAFLALGCVERKLHIRTEPEGAVVAVNGTEIGTTPIEWPFHHYGSVRVTFQLKGYETEQRIVKLKTPWYEYPVLDLFSDVVIPATIHNDHYVEITMRARESTPKEVDLKNAAALGQRATALRDAVRAENGLEEPRKDAAGGESGE